MLHNFDETRRALRVREFCKAFGLSRTTFYKLVFRRELRPRKAGKLTLIPADEARRWFDSLPIIEPETPPTRRTNRLLLTRVLRPERERRRRKR
jgi:excisionase family DNA binding protein